MPALERNVPQRLKPRALLSIYGTAGSRALNKTGFRRLSVTAHARTQIPCGDDNKKHGWTFCPIANCGSDASFFVRLDIGPEI